MDVRDVRPHFLAMPGTLAHLRHGAENRSTGVEVSGDGPTWSELERAATDDPVIYQLVTLARQGVPKERALIATVLFLAGDRKAYLAREVERLMHATP